MLKREKEAIVDNHEYVLRNWREQCRLRRTGTPLQGGICRGPVIASDLKELIVTLAQRYKRVSGVQIG